jgi:hypothetical protein
MQQKLKERPCRVCGLPISVCKERLKPPTEVWKHQMVNDPLKPEGSEVVVEGKMYGLPECKMEAGEFYNLAVSKEEAEAVEAQNQLRAELLKETKEWCVRCGHLPEDLKLEPGTILPVCKSHLEERDDLYFLQKAALSRERAQAGGTRFSIMLWEIRFLLRSLGKSNPKAKTLGDELESYMEEEEKAPERACLVCMGVTLKDAKSRGVRVCSRHYLKHLEEAR